MNVARLLRFVMCSHATLTLACGGSVTEGSALGSGGANAGSGTGGNGGGSVGSAGASGSGSGGAGGQQGGSSGTSPGCASPLPVSATKGDGPPRVYALTRLVIGDQSIDGQPSESPWLAYSRDLDGSDGPTQGCIPIAAYVVDGLCGEDNSLGQMFAVLGGGSTLQASAIAARTFNLLLVVDGAGTSGTQGVVGGILEAAPSANQPKGKWAVWSEGLMPGGLPKFAFAKASIADRTMLATLGTATVPFFPANTAQPARMLAHDLMVTARFNEDYSRIESGTITGYVFTKDLEVAISGATCSAKSPLPLGQISDLSISGSKCDAVSFGFGFQAERAEVGDVVITSPDNCSQQ